VRDSRDRPIRAIDKMEAGQSTGLEDGAEGLREWVFLQGTTTTRIYSARLDPTSYLHFA
jgi:hypothetical protein